MDHGLEWFIHLLPRGLRKEDEHPTNSLHGVRYSLALPTVGGVLVMLQSVHPSVRRPSHSLGSAKPVRLGLFGSVDGVS